MNDLITILVISLPGFTAEVSYETRMDCGEAILVAADSDLNTSGDMIAQCRATYAPSKSMRPIARPVIGAGVTG